MQTVDRFFPLYVDFIKCMEFCKMYIYYLKIDTRTKWQNVCKRYLPFTEEERICRFLRDG